jgi:2-polyprenyl-3-methyl-5-hydroxy-6-metoxy-1,4-benzoquinol methylase
MSIVPVPARARGREILDDPETPADIRARAMRDVGRSNRLFGGTRAVLRELRAIAAELPSRVRLVDVGTGLGDIPAAAQDAMARRGVSVETIGVDASESLLRESRRRLQGVVAGDARRLPLADGSADVVICSQVLHHFFDDDLKLLLAELDRVSRGWVIVSDLQRSWLAAGGFWLASSALRFHEVTRVDGMTSVLRGFQPSELESMVRSATGVTPTVRGGVFWRLTARWRARAGERARR